MINVSRLFCLLLFSFASLALVACGGSDDADTYDDGYGSVGDADFDEATLPADFPHDLIPDDYDTGTYTVFGGVEGAAFESDDPVEETIRHYTGLLGEPTISVGDDGDRSVQWQTTPWAISIIGNADESIVAFAKVSD